MVGQVGSGRLLVGEGEAFVMGVLAVELDACPERRLRELAIPLRSACQLSHIVRFQVADDPPGQFVWQGVDHSLGFW